MQQALQSLQQDQRLINDQASTVQKVIEQVRWTACSVLLVYSNYIKNWNIEYSQVDRNIVTWRNNLLSVVLWPSQVRIQEYNNSKI